MTLEQMEAYLRAQGIGDVGYSCLRGILPPSLESTPNAVTLVYRLNDVLMDEVIHGATYSYFHHYRAVNAALDSMTLWLSTMLQREGYAARPIPASQSVHNQPDPYTGLFQHKTGALHSGMGFIGKSALFVHKDFGPRVRLATVLTDCPVAPSGAPVECQCGSCRVCVDACPAGAITGELFVAGQPRERIFDAEKCSVYMKEANRHIGRGAVCGICVSRCPFGRKGRDGK